MKQVSTVKFLGLQLDECLHWDSHIGKVLRELAPLTGILYRLSHVLNDAAKRSIYYDLVHSKIVYMNIIWGTATQARLKSLEVVQKNCLKIYLACPT